MLSWTGGLGGGLRGGRGLGLISGGAKVEALGGHLGLVAVSPTLASCSVVVTISVAWLTEWNCTERRLDGAKRLVLVIVEAEVELGGGLVFNTSETNFVPVAKTFAALCLLW